jgi:hypothetical protein
VAQEQGLITQEGYEEQAQAYTDQANAAGVAAEGAGIAGIGADISGVLKGAAAVASLFTGGATAVIGQAATSSMGDPTGIGGLY